MYTVFGLGERRAAVEAPVTVQASIDIALLENLAERPDLVASLLYAIVV